MDADLMDADAVEGYLAAVERHLPGPASVRRDVLDELLDGVIEAGEDAADAGTQDVTAAALATIGHPAVIGAALADELRPRLARRRAVQILGVIATLHLGWLVYRWTVGFPPALVPDEVAGGAFLHAIDTLRTVGWVALVGALLMVIVTSLPVPRQVQVGVALCTIGTMAVAAVTGVTGILLVGQPTAAAMAAGSASAVLLIGTLAGSCQILRHLLARPATT